ncbi:Uncharacterised protein [Bordetella pertussis]|nr:Uncharacterised protein [Bordetella pertussis]
MPMSRHEAISSWPPYCRPMDCWRPRLNSPTPAWPRPTQVP